MKYELIELTKDHPLYGTGVNYQIKALKDFGYVKKGDLGGYVNNEYNVEQVGNCWIYNNAKMYGCSKIYDNAEIYNNAEMHGCSKIYDNAKMYDNAEMHGCSKMYNNAKMYGYSKIYDSAEMYDNTKIYDTAEICDSSEMHGYVALYDNYVLKDNKELYYPKLYNYKSYPIFDTKNKKPTKIKMGCYTRTIKEWQENFYNNDREFPKGDEQTKQRLYAINYILITLGEKLIKE